jgi:preprotein translocase subunit SecE
MELDRVHDPDRTEWVGIVVIVIVVVVVVVAAAPFVQ